MRGEIILSGLPVSHGIAIGPAYLVEIAHLPAPQHEVTDSAAEKKRFEAAVESAVRDLKELKEKSKDLPETAAGDVALLLDAHLAMLKGSRLIRGVLSSIETKKVNAEFAIELEIKDLTRQFEAIKDPYIAARVDDVEAVGTRLMRILMDVPYMSLSSVPQGGVVLAEELTPADTAFLDPRRFAGIATVRGGAAGHTAIMARGLGLPAVLGIKTLTAEARQGDICIIDGAAGKIILNPGADTLALYRGKRDEQNADRARLSGLQALPSATSDGTAVMLRANIEMPRELDAAKESGAEGIGLFRTEFMFMNRETLPSEDEQFEILAKVVKAFPGKPVTVRTLDIGGDKLVKSLGDSMANDENPALGLRAIRLSLKKPELLKIQFRAILRASVLGTVRILLPMVTTASELRAAREIYTECASELKKEGVTLAHPLPPLGCMIEIPAAALSADSLAAVADFFAIGTNDLIQYTVAIDRGNDQVAALYDPLNPAVLRLIEFTIQAAERAGIPVSVCGEMASNPNYTGLFLGLGVRDMSMGYASLPMIKSRVREIALSDASRHAQLVMDQYDSARILALVDDFNKT